MSRVKVRYAYVVLPGAELPGDGEHARLVAQGFAHLGQRADHGPDLVRVGGVAGARVRLGEHGEEVAGVVAAQVAVGLAVQPLPAAGCDGVPGRQSGGGAEDLEQPVHVVAARVVEHQLPLGGAESGSEGDVLEGEGADRPGGWRGEGRGGRRAGCGGGRRLEGDSDGGCGRREHRGLQQGAPGECWAHGCALLDSPSGGGGPVGRMRCSSVFTEVCSAGVCASRAGYLGCRTMRRWRTMKASRRAPMTILVHQELRVPSKEISACTVPRTRTPAVEPAT